MFVVVAAAGCLIVPGGPPSEHCNNFDGACLDLPEPGWLVAATWSFGFEPEHLEIQVGDVVRWVAPFDRGEDITWHDVSFTEVDIFDRYRLFDADRADDWDNYVDEGNNYTLRAKALGVHTYFCTLHEGMIGTLTVRGINESLSNRPVVRVLETHARGNLSAVGIAFHPAGVTSEVRWSIDGRPFEPLAVDGIRWTLSANRSGLQAGSHELRVRIDAADGTSDETTVPFDVSARTILEIQRPSPFSNVTGRFLVEGSAWDPDGNFLVVLAQVGNGSWQSVELDGSRWSFAIDSAQYPEGPLQFMVQANQAQGQVVRATTFNVQR